ncbi:MAG: LLM class flavin-dependent oxidoreductase [Thermomicrobiales bacterium]
MPRPLEVGVLLPDTENQMDGASAGWADLAAMTRTAEAVGFDSVWVTDHMLHRADKPLDTPVVIGGDLRELEGPWECWSLLSAIAAITERVEIGTLVICNSFRNPALLAKMADTVEEISGGRLILGLGAGWNEPEYRAFGFPFDHRVDRFEEGVQITTELLRTSHCDFDGRWYKVEDCELRPRGPRPEGPPIVIGTAGERMLGLTAKFADGWNTWFSQTNNDLEQLKALLRRVDAACEAQGRDPKSLSRSSAVKVEIGPHTPSTMSVPALTGGPEALADQLRDYAAAGLDHVQLWIEPNTVAGYQAFGQVLELLDQG